MILIIDAKSDRAAAWYASYGALPLADKPLTLVMALATFEADLKASNTYPVIMIACWPEVQARAGH